MSTSVSVVIPAHNAARTLPYCLAALAGQSRAPDEVLVVDDASSDGSGRLAVAAGARVVAHSVNQGVSAARNRGVAASTGDVVFFVDADVALAPDAVAWALAILQADPQVGCVHGVYDPEPLIDDGPWEHYKVLSNHCWRRRSVGRVGTALFALGAVRREVLLAAGGFDERLRDGEDVELSNRLRPLCTIVLTDRVVGRHDDASRARAVLSEQFRRSRLLVPMALAERRAPPAGPQAPTLTGQRPLAVACTALALLAAVSAVPVAAAGPWWPVPAVTAAALLACGVLADPGLVAFVRARRGTAFLGFFLAAQAAVLLTLVAGAAVGAVGALLAPGRAAGNREPANGTAAAR